MKCYILLIILVYTAALSDCDSKNDNTRKKSEKRTTKSSKKKSTDKRELDGQYDILGGAGGGGTAFSYTHVIQNHGKGHKVIHLPVSDDHFSDDFSFNDNDFHHFPASSTEEDFGSLNFEPTNEPYYGPVYVTAKPVLPAKDTHARTAGIRLNDNTNELPNFTPYHRSIPLFTPYHGALDKHYSPVPVQVIYRIPFQRSSGYQVPNTVSVNSVPYPASSSSISSSSIPYAIPKQYLNQIQSSPVPYSLFYNNYAGYDKPEINNEEQQKNEFSEEHLR